MRVVICHIIVHTPREQGGLSVNREIVHKFCIYLVEWFVFLFKRSCHVMDGGRMERKISGGKMVRYLSLRYKSVMSE